MTEVIASQKPALYVYAGFRKRVSAFLLDYLLIAAYLFLLLAVGLAMTFAFGALEETTPLFASPVVMDLVVFLIAVLPVILAFTLQESSPAQATWGKRKLVLRVVNAHGNRLSRSQAFVRSVLKFLPWQIAHTSIFHIPGWPFAPAEPTSLVVGGLILAQLLVLLSLILLSFGRNHRTLYDWAAGTFVIEA